MASLLPHLSGASPSSILIEYNMYNKTLINTISKIYFPWMFMFIIEYLKPVVNINLFGVPLI